jgi:excinuclease ABC subunit A
VRARIDGRSRARRPPTLDKKKEAHIEVVVDRFKVRDDLKLRLAESFETALKLTDGLALVVDMDGDGGRPGVLRRFACPVCGYSINELEPRLFSFNNPAGACPTCDGLGVSSSSIRSAWSAPGAESWPAAPSAAGTGATPTTSR